MFQTALDLLNTFVVTPAKATARVLFGTANRAVITTAVAVSTYAINNQESSQHPAANMGIIAYSVLAGLTLKFGVSTATQFIPGIDSLKDRLPSMPVYSEYFSSKKAKPAKGRERSPTRASVDLPEAGESADGRRRSRSPRRSGRR